MINDERWRAIEQALASDLFSTPVAHFLVAAFLGEGIDEFMGHFTMLEASLGLQSDKWRKQVSSSRIRALLRNEKAAASYGELFELRSEYVHGRAMGVISGPARVEARRLARQVANALVDAAEGLACDRPTFLQGLAPSKPPKALKT
ncbi:hypothetical protein [Phenylobacterium sp.]|uniref:hypothetical protein n=1 Tax=Phenylobacterium sp. TaxID=1871053 RepID=UPI0035B350FF